MSQLRTVLIRVSAQTTSDVYLARSYPDDDVDNNGQIEIYEVPVYKVFLEGTDAAGTDVKKGWTALRFMPYWNDPKHRDPHYETLGWINSGLPYVARKRVQRYKDDYRVHNRVSRFTGAIVVQGAFYIHGGPESPADWGWAAGGCVEIIGSFDDFRRDILGMAGSTEMDIQKAMKALVAAGRLYVQYDLAQPPNFKSKLKGEVYKNW